MKGSEHMTPKQEKFCDEYLIDMNATQAAIRAGYSADTAYSAGQRLLKNVDVKTRIQNALGEQKKSTIATAEEVMEYLTSVVRGESKSHTVVVEGCGDGVSKARQVEKLPDEKEKLKAAELLGKRFALFTDKVQADVTMPVFSGDDNLED